MMKTAVVRPKTVFFQPCGAIDSANALHWNDQFCQAVRSPKTFQVVVDMGKLESLDSDGLMVLVSAVKMAQAHHKTFSICSVPNPIRIVLELAQLDRVLNIHESYTECVAVA